MKKLLEAINRGLLRCLNENNMNLLTDLDDINLDLLDSILTKTINNKLRYDNAARNLAQRIYSELREDFANFIYVKDDHFCISFNGADRDIDKKYKYVIILGDSYTYHLKSGYYLDDKCLELTIHDEDDPDWDLPDVIFTTNIKSAKKCIDSINNDSYFRDKTSWEFEVDWAVYNITKDFTAKNYWCEGIYDEDRDTMNMVARRLNIH